MPFIHEGKNTLKMKELKIFHTDINQNKSGAAC